MLTQREIFTKTVFILALLMISSCSTKSRPTLGETITLTPGWSRLKQSSIRAFSDPNVWGALLTSALLQVDNLDEEISDQLRENQPLFGSTRRAIDASDNFRALTEIAYVSTALAVPGPAASGEWLSTKARLVGAEWMAVKTAREFNSGVQDLTQRERPNEKNDISFASGHVTISSTQAQMADLNIEYLPIGDTSKRTLSLALDSFAALAGWARIEAGEHYPSDTMAGWAFGHFFGHLAEEFIIPNRQLILVRPQLTSDSGGIELVIRF